jgi:tetratricopeptide (TPR) repeat protein/DNA-binding winged helix-turn-helix (wHTH) protein
MLQGGEGALTGAAPGARMLPIASVYRFDNIEVDVSKGYLKRGGNELHLRQQSFHLLVYLLQRRDGIVSKEELAANFWQGAAVTDNALVQCIKEIRKALGDDPREPRFIRTMHKIGYRFIAEVVEERAEHATVARIAAGVGPESAKVAAPAKLGFWRQLRWLLPMLVAALALAGWAALRRTAAARADVILPSVPGKKTLAIMYFENQSARQDLNWLSEGLAGMFIARLSRFDRLTVLSRDQLRSTLARIGRRPSNGIRLEDALLIARKSHAEGVLLGSFMAPGDKLLIHVRLFDAVRARLLAADQFEVERPADILSLIDMVSPKLAAGMETPTQAADNSGSLTRALTRNPEAYRYYSLGVSKAQSFQNSQGISLLRKAIQLDPQFAMAYARIGYAYSVTDFVPEKGQPFLAKAIQLSDHLAPIDRLYVAAWSAIAGRDYAGAILTLRQIVDQYPAEIEAYTRLARLLHREERPQEAIAVVQRGLAAGPDCGDLYNVLGVCYLGLARYQEAIAAHLRYLQLSPHDPNAHDSLGMSYQQAGRFPQAAAEYEAALSQDPEFEPAIIHLGDVRFQQGRFRDAVAQYQRYIDVTGSEKARAVGYGSMAQVFWRLGDFNRAGQAARNEDRYAKGTGWISLRLALARGGTGTYERLKQRFLASFQDILYPGRGSRDELRSHDYYLGAMALLGHKPDDAIARFQAALRHLPPSSGLDLYEDCLANAYSEVGYFDEAIREYRRILSLNPNYPLAEYFLAKAYQKTGESRLAQAAYLRFLDLWKAADADIPEILDARKQLDSL